jgi:hypothetical protein
MVKDEALWVTLGFVKLVCMVATPLIDVKVTVVPTGNCVWGLNEPELPAPKAMGCERIRPAMIIDATIAPADILVDVCIF